MSVRDWWSDRSTSVKVLLVLCGLVVVGVLLSALVVMSVVVGVFVMDMGEPMPPTAEFSHEYSQANETVQVTLTSDESLHAESVYVTVNGERRGAEWDSSAGMISPGDSATVSGVATGDVVAVRYEGAEQSYVLDEWTVG